MHLPAPTGGLNTISAGSAMPLSDAVQLFNMVAAEYGLRSRLGSREWLTGLQGATDSLVRTVLPHKGSTKSGSADKLFVTTSNGIYDVTSSYQAWQASTAYVIGDVVINDDGKVYTCDTDGTSASSGGPTGTGSNIADGTTRWDYTSTIKALSFATTTGDAGYGTYHGFVTSGGHFLLYADEVNGLHKYTESTNTWAAVTDITNVNATDLRHVAVFKNRLWFVEKDSQKAWHLDAGAISGAATQFPFTTSGFPRHGGTLLGLWNWTYDGGAGLDDSLVALTTGGDVLVYQGTDPTSASAFGLKGVWYVGAFPAGRQVATHFGGDLLLLTKSGLRPLSQLVTGREDPKEYATAKIANLFNALMLSRSSLPGWSVRLHPEDNTLLVTVPTTAGANTEQLAMSLWNRSWSRYRDLPMYAADTWAGKLYFGSADGKVYVNDGYVDGVELDDASAYTPVQWAVLGAFSNWGVPRQKRVQMIRPTLLAENDSPEFAVGARYKYDFTELGAVSGGTLGADEWDGGVWDTATWAGEFNATQTVRGASGMGVDVAIAIRGTATSRTVLVGTDVTFDVGGFL
jgi:hypothetical protein